MHVGSNPGDGSTLDADGLAMTIRRIENRGYTFATLPEIYAAAYPRWRVDADRRPRWARSGAASAAVVGKFLRLGLPIYCGGPRGRYVALTFDDGPGPATAAALKLLRRFGQRATFFLVGRNLRFWPRLPRAELALGAVGDHTWTHPFLMRLAPREMDEELARGVQQAGK
jgi:peptidoglycan/xylan/chitin deacetylase (PgdA/CDA1 family)